MFYVWVGQKNTTVGNGHKSTGRLNLHGDLIAFETRKDRDLFFNRCYSRKVYVTLERTNKQDAKSVYFAGMTMKEYKNYLNEVDNGMISVEYWDIEDSYYQDAKVL